MESSSTTEEGQLPKTPSQTDSRTSDAEENANRLGSFLSVFKRAPVEVTTLNKVICSTAFSLAILAIGGYIAFICHYHVSYPAIMEKSYFFMPVRAIYILLGSDILNSILGIWTCVCRTGPQPMILSCVWLLLSSLFHICTMAWFQMNIDLKIKHKMKLMKRVVDSNVTSTTTTISPNTAGIRPDLIQCFKMNTENEECKVANRITLILWCSLILILAKLLVILLCRINYPQVFNWLLNKDVLLDEEIVEHAVRSLTHMGALGGAYFTPLDIERLAARGSIYGTEIEAATSKTIFVKASIDDNGDEKAGQRKGKRRATLISTSIA